MENKEIYWVNDYVKLGRKEFEIYLTDELSEDCQYNLNYKIIDLDYDLLQIKVNYDSNLNEFILNFLYNVRDIHIDTNSLINYLIKKISINNLSFDSENTKHKFYKKYFV